MLTSEQINDLHRLYWSDRWPIRKIERHLKMGWKTIKKYLNAPAQGPAQRERHSKLDAKHHVDVKVLRLRAGPVLSSNKCKPFPTSNKKPCRSSSNACSKSDSNNLPVPGSPRI